MEKSLIVLLVLLVLSSLSWCALYPSEVKALEAMKVAWNGSHPPDWGDAGQGCSWKGVNCSADGHVSALNLNGFGLKGEIPVEMSGLVDLERLEIGYEKESRYHNFLTGKIPPELGHLSKLTVLRLDSNSLSGSTPPELGNLPELTWLDLSTNFISGSIPPELGNFSRLTDLDLSFNSLSGSIPPELGKLSALTALILSSNSLSGSIPPELGNMPKLTYLDLSSNPLSGSIPPELGNLSKLTYLHLYSNSLSGLIPPKLGNLPELNFLSLSSNSLSGSIPPELGNLSKLTDLDLSGNFLSGLIPPELGNLPELSFLSLSSNSLSGSIPPELGNLSNLFDMFLNSNSLLGSIPPELGNILMLSVLNLNYNSLSGSIPPELGYLSGLFYLDLSSNSLSGSIPSGLGKLSRLTYLYLSSNSLSGSIPSELGKLSRLTLLSLSSNSLSGSIPPELGKLSVLTNLDLSFNSLSGSIPPELGLNLTLISFNVASNRLNGSIPTSILASLQLTHLDLSNNQFNGDFLHDVVRLSNLNFLDVSRNLFHGNVPPGVGDLSGLVELHLSDNRFSGHLPATIQNLANLSALSISGNSFVDFNASMFCGMENLRVLKIANLSLSLVPECFRSTNLADLDISWNPIGLYHDKTPLAVPGVQGLPLHLSSLRMAGCNMKSTPFRFCELAGNYNDSSSLGTLSSTHTYSSLDFSQNPFQGLGSFALNCISSDFSPLQDLSVNLWNLSSTGLSAFNIQLPPTTSILDLRGNYQPVNPSLLQLAIENHQVVPASARNESVELKMSCPIWSIPGNNNSVVYIEWEAFDYFNCSCLSGYFGAVPDDCRVCNLPEVSTTCHADGSLTITNGFFPAVSTPHERQVMDVLNTTKYLADPVRCPVEHACVAERCIYAAGSGNLTCHGRSGTAQDLCAEGYGDRLCARCAAEFYVSSERECEACPGKHSFERSNGFLGLLGGVSVVALALFVLLRGFGVAAFVVEIMIVAMFVWLRLGEGWVITLMVFLFVVYSSLQGAGGSEGLIKSLMFYLQTFVALAPAGIFEGVLAEVFHSWNPFHAMSFASFHPSGIECFDALEGLSQPDVRLGFTLLLPLVCVVVAAVVVVLSEMVLWIPAMKRAVDWYEAQRRRLLSIVDVRKVVKHVGQEFLSEDLSMELLHLEDENDEMRSGHGGAPAVDDVHEDSNRWVKLAAAAVHACLFVLYAVYFEVANAVLAVFHSPSRGFMGAPYEYLVSPLSDYGWQHDAQARNLLVLGSIGVVGFVMAIPLLYAALLALFYWRNFSRGDFHGPANWIGFLYEGFRPQVFWYEFVWMARRLLLAVFLSVVPVENAWSPVLICLLLIVSLLLHGYARPFENRWENAIERLSLLALLLTFVLGQMIEPGALQGNLPRKGERWEDRRTAFLVLALVNGVVLVGYALVFASNYIAAVLNFVSRLLFKKELKEILLKVSLTGLTTDNLTEENEMLRARVLELEGRINGLESRVNGLEGENVELKGENIELKEKLVGALREVEVLRKK